MAPAEFHPSAMEGRIKPVQSQAPEIGTQCRYRATTYCSNIATMNTGIETPSSATMS